MEEIISAVSWGLIWRSPGMVDSLELTSLRMAGKHHPTTGFQLLYPLVTCSTQPSLPMAPSLSVSQERTIAFFFLCGMRPCCAPSGLWRFRHWHPRPFTSHVRFLLLSHLTQGYDNPNSSELLISPPLHSLNPPPHSVTTSWWPHLLLWVTSSSLPVALC